MSLIQELKRRNVFRIAVAYVIVAWLVLQVVGQVADPLRLPEWTETLFIVLMGAGLPMALILAWAYELTPDGLKKEKGVDPAFSIASQTGRKLDFIIIAVLMVALGYFALDKFVFSPGSKAVSVEANVTEAAEQANNEAETVVVADKSIAVLPFENISQDEANDPFTNGIHDDLLTHIAKIGSIKTISRTSVQQYRSTTKTIPQIARELGVATILEGGVQRLGDQVRINVQLIDANTDENLWAETYDRQLTATNIFQIQSEIAMAIADALRATLSPGEQARLTTIPTESLAALEAYFLGKQAMAKRTSVTLAKAVDYFNQAIELDPHFVLAYVGLADTLALQVEYSGLPPKATLTAAKTIIEKALELDDQSGEAFTSLGYVYMNLSNPDASETAFQRALALSPNYVSVHHWYANLLRDYGRYEQGMEHINKAIQLDPLSPVLQSNVGTTLLELGRPVESLAQYRKGIDMDAGFPPHYWSIGGLYWTIFGKLDEALTWFKQAQELNPGDANIAAWIGLVYLDLGAEADAEHWINKALELGPDSVVANWAKQMLLLYKGDNIQAEKYADKVLAQEPGWVLSLATVRNRYLQAGRSIDAGALYEKQFPALLHDDNPKIDRSNVDAAIDLALVLRGLGQSARAQLLLERSLEYAKSTPIPRLRWYNNAYGIPEQVQIYALQGKTRQALTALRQAIDDGWRGLWWYWLQHDPNLDSIRAEPEFQVMLKEIRLDMASQLKRVRQESR